MRTTTRIVNGVTGSAARKNCLTSTAAILSIINTTPLATRHSQQQEPLFKEVPNITLDALKFRMAPVNTDVRELENFSPNAFENSAASSTKQRDHSPSRIANHSKFKFDFRTLDERIADAKPREVKQSRSVQLRG